MQNFSSNIFFNSPDTLDVKCPSTSDVNSKVSKSHSVLSSQSKENSCSNLVCACQSQVEVPTNFEHENIESLVLFPELQSSSLTCNELSDSGRNSLESSEGIQLISNEESNNEESTIDVKETIEMRLAREERESEELARQLMAEEAMESYRQGLSYFEANANSYEEEDMQALRLILEEDEMLELYQNGEGYYDEEDNDSAEDLSYESLLRLGERIGDVKEDRWKMIAQKEIAKLEVVKFEEVAIKTESKDLENEINDSLHQCLICQCSYDKEEKLRKLPCGHYFHVSCIDYWLKSKDVCPYCRQSIVQDE